MSFNCRLVLCISAFGVACILILGLLPNLTQFWLSWMDILLVRFASVLGLMMQMGIAVGVLLRHYRWKSWSEHRWSTSDTRRTSTHNGNEHAVMGPNWSNPQDSTRRVASHVVYTWRILKVFVVLVVLAILVVLVISGNTVGAPWGCGNLVVI